MAMNIEAGTTPLVLLCPAWKRLGSATTVKPGTVILHSPADDVVSFADSQELLRSSGLPKSALIVVGTDHRLADPVPLKKMLEAVERAASMMRPPDPDYIKTLSAVLKEMDDELSSGLRGWPQHLGYSPGHDEVAITREIRRRLKGRGLVSKGRRYPSFRQSCDIVSNLAGATTIWIEAKVYWTVYFGDNDPGRTIPKLAGGSQTWQARIEALVSDCSDKLLKMLPARTQVAGLLLGFDRESHPIFSRINPSTDTIDNFLRCQVHSRLPGWTVCHLSDDNGWRKPDSCRPELTLLTRPMLLVPASREKTETPGYGYCPI